MKWKVQVNLPSDIPVVGVEIIPSVRVINPALEDIPAHSFSFSWHRFLKRIACSVHCDKLATVQCACCARLNLQVEESYHCSTSCFLNEWKNHLERHLCAAETFNTNDVQEARKTRSCGSWSAVDYEDAKRWKQEKEWMRVGSSKYYIPTMDDIGSILRLEYATVDSKGSLFFPISTIETKPVIVAPDSISRCIIQCPLNGQSFNPKGHSSTDLTFSVLSYNILADMYASMGRHSYCPTWALVWEYRRKKLLHEIIQYDADIICLQEVQDVHFENFFKPELTKCGYSVMYKKKTQPIYSKGQSTIDGCATFYRHKLFKEIMKYELEFGKTASKLVEALEPHLRKDSYRLFKDNVALVAILETLNNERTHDCFQSRICVANTHIFANIDCPDVKLFQVVKLVTGLEKIVDCQIPLLICGDFNSLPSSDPHRFIVTGRCDPISNGVEDPCGIFNHLKLCHSIPLVSAYASFSVTLGVEEQQKKMNTEANEPQFTNFTPWFSGTLDYIFYTADSLRVEGLLELVDRESLGAGIPSTLWPSDHIALMANFRLKPPTRFKRCSQPPPLDPWQIGSK
ncbi:Endonuclease/exonuclease/phosphatase [Trema orientale]|uniref:poly(A)-specific ribonuclease n=1 Tax=Trema orientale TaxID=63057 RepID=A0A2P5G1T2_TREOI|nr:Endonuclease/exonuclease/phosphatase [Trema orientale]